LFGLTCPSNATIGQWIWNSNDCKCLTATVCIQLSIDQCCIHCIFKTCMDISATVNCGWCPTRQRGYLGDMNGPSSGIDCPPGDQGQWTFDDEDCKCLAAKSCFDIRGTNCGWCPSKQHAYKGSLSGPAGLTCNSDQISGQWTWNNADCYCLNATVSDITSLSVDTNWS
jgi:hypothetical protein